MYDFKSGFADNLNRFIEQKRALGVAYKYPGHLVEFDKMCAFRFPHKDTLTKEVCTAFAVKKDTENSTSLRNRISPIREFAKFLIRRGEEVYVLPTDFAKKAPRCLPYIYSREQISQIWDEFDNMPSSARLPARYIILPAITRVLYCCGLRPIEICRLAYSDVDLSVGKLFIRESKGHRDRIVIMANDLTEYLRGYERRISLMFQNRKWFFPSPYNTACSVKWISDVFQKIRKKLNIYGANGQRVRLYDLRHTFATHRLYEWMKEGTDINSMLHSLSAYMGHEQISDTCYYIHLVPEQLQTIAGFDFSQYESLIPEANYDE